MVICFWVLVGVFGAYLLWEALQQLRIEGRRERTRFDLMIEENHKKRLHEAKQMERLLKNIKMKGKR
tara:strand:+ start:801 stop:1001 length:201 start_codon:yes stop_codon:yes gene_type:complete